MLLVIFRISGISSFYDILFYGALINSWLALFNLLPFGILDGNKVLAWSRKHYSILIGVSVLFVILSYLI